MLFEIIVKLKIDFCMNNKYTMLSINYALRIILNHDVKKIEILKIIRLLYVLLN